MMTSPRSHPNRVNLLPESSRFELIVKIASGGMATVYVGCSRTRGPVTRLFAIKRAHAHMLDDAAFRKMFVTEARLASRIHHPNVVAVQDVEELDDELIIVMDYVEGASLADLREVDLDERARIAMATRIVLDAAVGLHAAHELRSEDGKSLDIVHRDVSPHNILIGVDGIARLTDFGIAKMQGPGGQSSARTATGALKGKLGYMAPEYIAGNRLDRRADIFALGAILWETLTAQRLFKAPTEIEMIRVVSECNVSPPSAHAPLPRALDEVVLRALTRSPDDRWSTARDFADALERVARDHSLLAPHPDVGAIVEHEAHDVLAKRRSAIRSHLGIDADSASQEISIAGYQGFDRTATFGTSAPEKQKHSDDETTTTQFTPPPSAPPPPSLDPTIFRPAEMTPSRPLVVPTRPWPMGRIALVLGLAVLAIAIWKTTRPNAPPPEDAPPSATMPIDPPAAASSSTTTIATPAPSLPTEFATSPTAPPTRHAPTRRKPAPPPLADSVGPSHAPPNPYKKQDP
jgi:serine/threonine-protein kinase